MQIPFTSRPIRPALAEVLEALQPGKRLRITQLVRVGLQSWPATVTGSARELNSLATGIATDRDPHDDILVALLHFTKDNGELASVALDENTRIEVLD